MKYLLIGVVLIILSGCHPPLAPSDSPAPRAAHKPVPCNVRDHPCPTP